MKNSNIGSIGRLENLLIYIVTIFLFGLLLGYYKVVMPYMYGDTAFLLELISNLADGAQATSRMLAQNASEIKLATVELAVYCQRGLAAAQFTTDPFDVFSSLHAYIILYLVVPVAKVFGALNAMSAFTALAFSSVPCIAYRYLRKSGVSIAASLLAAAVCIMHPAWLISSGGQFYVDRLFIPLALLFAINLHHYFRLEQNELAANRVSLFWVLLFGMLGGLTSERNMLVIGIFSFGYALLARTQFKKRVHIIGFSLLCVTYVYLYMHYFSGTADNARVQASLFQISGLIDAVQRPGIVEYLWFNAVLLVLPALLAPRIFIAVLPIVAINCFITVGGAEKNGWLTHYHSHYFGFVIAAFLIAIASINDEVKGKLRELARRALIPLMLGILLSFSVTIKHYYQGQGIFLSLWDYYGKPEHISSALAQKNMFDKLADNVPVGATVTATQWGMAAWYDRGNTVNLFPLGMGINDYIMVQAEGDMPDIQLLSAVRYKADAKLANECFVPVITENYEKLSQQGNWMLFKKTAQ